MGNTVLRKHLCPVCLRTPVADLNVFPARMWDTNTQTWPCEHCSTTVTRTFDGVRWSAWSVKGGA